MNRLPHRHDYLHGAKWALIAFAPMLILQILIVVNMRRDTTVVKKDTLTIKTVTKK